MNYYRFKEKCTNALDHPNSPSLFFISFVSILLIVILFNTTDQEFRRFNTTNDRSTLMDTLMIITLHMDPERDQRRIIRALRSPHDNPPPKALNAGYRSIRESHRSDLSWQ
jgi:hypothetical protein